MLVTFLKLVSKAYPVLNRRLATAKYAVAELVDIAKGFMCLTVLLMFHNATLLRFVSLFKILILLADFVNGVYSGLFGCL